MSSSSGGSTSTTTQKKKTTTTTTTPSTANYRQIENKTTTPTTANYRQIENKAPTTTTTTVTTPGYNAAAGYYVGKPGQSDEDRTREAISYYASQGMTQQLNNALNYAASKGYNIATTPSTANYRQIENKVSTPSSSNTSTGGLMSKVVSAYNKADQALGGILPGGSSSPSISSIENSPAYRAIIGDPNQGYGIRDMASAAVMANPVGGTAAGISSLAKALPSVAKAVSRAGSASGLASKAFSVASKGADGVAGIASKAFSTVGKAPAAVANVIRNAPTALKVGVPAVGIGALAVNQAAKELGIGQGSNLTQEDIQTMNPAQVTGGQSPNTMTVSTGLRAPSGGYTVPGGYVNSMGGAPAGGEVDITGQMPNGNNMPQLPGIDFFTLLNMMGMNQQLPEPPVEIIQPEMPDFLAQQQELMALIDQLTQQNQAMSMQYLNQMTAQLDQLEKEIIARYEQQGTELDPATMAALTEIRNQVNLRRQQLMEEMNRRGLLQSGIWIEEENRILSNQLTAEERLLSNRLAEAQNAIMNTLASFAQQRMNIMGSSLENQMNLMANSANLKLNALQNLQNQQNQWAQRQAEQQAAAQQAAAARAASQQKQQMDLARWLYELLLKQANADREYELDRMQTVYNVNKPYYSPNTGGSGMTTTEKKNNALADAYFAVDLAKNGGLSNDQVAQNIMSQYAELTRYGVDPNAVLDYLYQRYPEQNSGSWYTQLDERLGGWLPFGAGR